MDAAALALPFLVALIVVALAFDFLNGMNDAANAIATIVSTRVLRPQYAVLWAAFFNFIAFMFFGLHVAETVGRGIVQADVVNAHVIFGALAGAIVWQIVTQRLGIPSSSSHALIGGLVGAGIAKAGIHAVVWSGVGKTVAAIFLSPGLGLLLALLLMLIVSWIFVRSAPYGVDNLFRRIQFVSASCYALGHGGNDAQKTMGIIAVLLYSQGILGATFYVPYLGGDRVPDRDGRRHDGRRLAHRQNHGLEDHAAHTDAGFLRGDRRFRHAVYGDLSRYSGFHHAHDHRLDHRRGRGEKGIGGALGGGAGNRHCLDHYDSGVRAARRAVLLAGRIGRVTCPVRC